jgi:hypothetical protein
MKAIELPRHDDASAPSTIRLNGVAPPLAIPPGHIGPVVLPGTGRMVWWTGRVAIGLRHQPTRDFGPITQSALWVQSLMLRSRRGRLAAV